MSPREIHRNFCVRALARDYEYVVVRIFSSKSCKKYYGFYCLPGRMLGLIVGCESAMHLHEVEVMSIIIFQRIAIFPSMRSFTQFQISEISHFDFDSGKNSQIFELVAIFLHEYTRT